MSSQNLSINSSLIISRRLLRIAIFFLLAVFTAFFSNILLEGNLGFLYPLTNKCFSLVCHQDPLRSFSYSGIIMQVCARCTGLYSGAALISLTAIFKLKIKAPSIRFIYISFIPVLTDLILYNTGIYNYNKGISFTTGFIFGSVLFIYILTAIENYLYKDEE